MTIITSNHRAVLALCVLAFASTTLSRLVAAESSPVWNAPTPAHITLTQQENGILRITSAVERTEFALESTRILPAKTGDSFEVNMRIKAAPSTRAYPDLVCYDGKGREIPVPSSLGRENPYVTTEWRTFSRVFVVQPGTETVRARIRGSFGMGKGALLVADLAFRPKTIDPYATGALITQPHAFRRKGVVLESNFGILNHDMLSSSDRDGDGKWALVTVDLDQLTAPAKKGEDWRSGFEDNPNVILWSDGAVLKSDTVHTDRAPDCSKALHFRMQVHPGPYGARIGDPGRAVAVSLDGQTWKRHEAGHDINLGTLAMTDGIIEFWLDACYRDPVSIGPAYFDYVRLTPTLHAPSVDRLFAAARRKPQQVTRGSVDEQRVPVSVSSLSNSGSVAESLRPPDGTPTSRGFATMTAWPVRCGLPIPRGELISPENIVVLDSTGAKIPGQNRVTATWPDGSARWIFVDLMHRPTGDASDGKYTIAYGNRVHAASAPNPVKTTRTADGIEIDTGAIRFLVSGSRFGMVENVRLAAGQLVQAEPIVAEIVESSGRTWRASELPVEKIAIEQPGPLHTVILVETKLAESGKPSAGFYHRARIHAYADSPLVEIDYFVANTDSRPARDMSGSMASRIPVKSIRLRVKPAQTIVGAQHALGSAGAAGALVQKSEEDALTLLDGAETEMRARLPGWLALRSADGSSVNLGVADFREQFPKALRWSADEIKIDLWAEEGGDYDWIEGVGKTHRVDLLYGAAASPSPELLARMPLLAVAAPEWYAHSGAMGRIDVASTDFLPEVENTLVRNMKESVIGRVGLGFENYGDHSSGGYIKGTFLWDNNEYDLPAACMVHFARTGDRDALQLGLASALHYLDVDTIHYSSKHADWARANHVHSHALFGHHTAGGPNFQHAGYVQGLIWYGYFTGDPVGVSGAQGIADWVLRHLGDHTSTMERALGHPLMTLNDVYEATGDEQYLRKSAQLVDLALKWEHPLRSGFPAPITESPAYYSGSPFNAGLTFSALMKFNTWANLPEIDAMLERLARWVLTDVWRPPGALQHKGGSPRLTTSAQCIGNHGRVVSFAYERTKDPLFLVVPQRLTLAGYGQEAEHSITTRSTGLVYNYLPWFLATLKREGNPQPDPELEIEAPAETSVAQGGKVRIAFKVRNAGATPITDLRGSFRTRLDFKVNAPTPAPTALRPGETVELWYEIQAPDQINLSCEYNHTAFGHWTALYRRSGRAHLAHRPVKIVIMPPQPRRRVRAGVRAANARRRRGLGAGARRDGKLWLLKP